MKLGQNIFKPIYFSSIASKAVGLYKRSRVRFLGLEPVLGVFGGDERNAPSGVRTHDLPIARRTPYPLRHGFQTRPKYFQDE